MPLCMLYEADPWHIRLRQDVAAIEFREFAALAIQHAPQAPAAPPRKIHIYMDGSTNPDNHSAARAAVVHWE